MTISFDDFLKVDIRVGTIVDAQPFPEARHPAYRLWVDFGPELGVKKTSAQVTRHYPIEDVAGPPGRGRGQLPAEADREVHERDSGPRISGRRRGSGDDRHRPCRPERRPSVLNGTRPARSRTRGSGRASLPPGLARRRPAVPRTRGMPLYRQPQDGAQSAPGRISQHHVAAMASRHVTGDGKSETGAAGFRIA